MTGGGRPWKTLEALCRGLAGKGGGGVGYVFYLYIDNHTYFLSVNCPKFFIGKRKES